MKPITTTLASILAIIFAFALVFGMSNDTLAQGADDCTGDCDGPDDDGGEKGLIDLAGFRL